LSTYRYLATDILTGETLFDNMPTIVSSVTAQLNGIGSCSGALQLYEGIPNSVKLDMIGALEPFKSVFWVLQDDQPIWGGPIISWSPTTMVGDQLPFQAATMETIFQYRLINQTYEYTSTDAGAIMRFLATYALGKTPNGNISGLNTAGPHLGLLVNVNIDGTIYQSVYDAWNQLVSTYDIEFTIAPAWISSNTLGFNLLIGNPLMRPFSSTSMQFIYPSEAVIDYQWTRQANQLGNYIYATGSDGVSSSFIYTSAAPNGVNSTELNAGYPLLEATISMQQPVINGQSDVDSFANTWLKTSSISSQVTPTLSLGPGPNVYPRISDIQLGDECYFAATSPIHPAQTQPAGGPGIIYNGRITGWSVTPPSQGNAEAITINLGALDAVVSGS
jgi:hypothetical protein